MKRINSETVQRILDTAQIVDVVSDFVSLKRSGSGYKGLCPFHNERTPSFSVSPSKNICKCFSCGKGGSPVNFIMEMEQMSFSEALRYLADKYHIQIEEEEMTSEQQEAESKRASMFAVNEFAARHFATNLMEDPDGRAVGLSYFRSRGINEQMVKRFGLGYALDRSDALIQAAARKGFNTQFLVDTGLAVRRDNGELYDRFKGRVIYPVYTVSGKVVAFGGRTLRSDKNVAKYVNSPESDIYHKNRELYGLFQAKHAISRLDKCILVEGYMDVISMHQRGVENVVASSGTSLTEGQIRLIHRFTSNVTLVYDADPAGIKASLRGIGMLLAEGLNIRLLLLPPGEDPDSFAQSHTAEEVERYFAEHETDFITFVTNVQLKNTANDPKARAQVINDVVDSISAIPDPVVRNEYVQRCSQLLGISDQVLNTQVSKFMAKRLEKLAQDHIREKNRREAGLAPDPGADAPGAASHSPAEPIDTEIARLGEQSAAAGAAGALPPALARRLHDAEREAIKYIVRYGQLFFGYGRSQEGEAVPLTVLDAFDLELRSNDFSFQNSAYSKIMQLCVELADTAYPAEREAMEAEARSRAAQVMATEAEAMADITGDMESIRAREQKVAQRMEGLVQGIIREFDRMFFTRHLASHPDDDVRLTVNDLAEDKYVLSKVHTRYSHVPAEDERLSELVPQAIFAWRDALLQKAIVEVRTRLAAIAEHNPANAPLSEDSAQELRQLMVTLGELQQNRTLLAKQLGERVYPGHV